jgi:hypothetical protein
MVKFRRKQKVCIPTGLIDSAKTLPETITSCTLFVSAFLDGFPGPSFLILPSKKYSVDEELISSFSGKFKIKFYCK